MIHDDNIFEFLNFVKGASKFTIRLVVLKLLVKLFILREMLM